MERTAPITGRREPSHFTAIKPSLAVAIVLCACAALCSCSLFHHAESPQQQFAEALSRGDAARANQIWLGMSDEDRNRFRRGEGFNPKASAQEAQSQIMRHQAESAGTAAEESAAPDARTLGGSLSSLPGASGSQPPPAAESTP